MARTAELQALRGQQAQVERLICRTPPQTRDGALVVAATLLEAGAAADDFPDTRKAAGPALATFTLEQAWEQVTVGVPGHRQRGVSGPG